MNKSYWRQAINLLFYLALQVFIPPIVSLEGTCFMYIGFLLFLPWVRHNMLGQLLLSFGIGMLVDLFYQGVGIHAFTAVLLLYCRNLLLYFFLAAQGKHAGVAIPTFTHLGVVKFMVYILLFTVLYHAVAVVLDYQAIQLVILHPSKFLLGILLGYFSILLPSLFAKVMLHIYAP